MSAAVRIASDRLELTVEPGFGGRVTALRCLTHDRQWLAEPVPGLAAAEGGAYGPAEAVGWDELFPSVLPGAATPGPWPAPLRDHGELWGRPWEIIEQDAARLGLAYEDARLGFRFERTIALDGGAVRCGYRLTSRRDEPLPYQWSMHPILRLRPGERIVLPDVEQVRGTGVAHPSLPPGPVVLGWPEHEGVSLASVRPSDGATVMKLYADVRPHGRVAVQGDPCELSLATDVAFAPYLGIYVNYGGWPAGGPLHHVGLEPTNAPEDDLDSAVGSGRVGVLDAGETRTWQVELALGRGCEPVAG